MRSHLRTVLLVAFLLLLRFKLKKISIQMNEHQPTTTDTKQHVFTYFMRFIQYTPNMHAIHNLLAHYLTEAQWHRIIYIIYVLYSCMHTGSPVHALATFTNKPNSRCLLLCFAFRNLCCAYESISIQYYMKMI